MPPPAQTPDILFYDGHCGLCHSAVKFVVKQDRSGKAFRFAPLYGKTFEATVPVDQRRVLCDSMVVQTCEGLLLMRSNALIRILQRLGGKWEILAAVMAVFPGRCEMRSTTSSRASATAYLGAAISCARSFRVTSARDSIRDRKSVDQNMIRVQGPDG